MDKLVNNEDKLIPVIAKNLGSSSDKGSPTAKKNRFSNNTNAERL